jgi:hypothetical protein
LESLDVSSFLAVILLCFCKQEDGFRVRQRKMKPTMMNLLHLLTLAKINSIGADSTRVRVTESNKRALEIVAVEWQMEACVHHL